MNRSSRLRIGTSLLAIAALGIIGASIAMVSHGVDLTVRAGRHLLAGALANGILSILFVVVALVPMRRGERWAFWAYLVGVIAYGVPMFVVDAAHVMPERLLMTLLPQGLGLIAASVGLALVGSALFAGDGH